MSNNPRQTTRVASVIRVAIILALIFSVAWELGRTREEVVREKTAPEIPDQQAVTQMSDKGIVPDAAAPEDGMLSAQAPTSSLPHQPLPAISTPPEIAAGQSPVFSGNCVCGDVLLHGASAWEFDANLARAREQQNVRK